LASRQHDQLVEERKRLGAKGNAMLLSQGCATPRFFVGTGQIQRRIISWELARGVRGKLTREEL
jgi:hypothetical protein